LTTTKMYCKGFSTG